LEVRRERERGVSGCHEKPTPERAADEEEEEGERREKRVCLWYQW